MEERKKALIEVVKWYKDEYYKSSQFKNICKDLIKEITSCKDEKHLAILEQTVDGWIDY